VVNRGGFKKKYAKLTEKGKIPYTYTQGEKRKERATRCQKKADGDRGCQFLRTLQSIVIDGKKEKEQRGLDQTWSKRGVYYSLANRNVRWGSEVVLGKTK